MYLYTYVGVGVRVGICANTYIHTYIHISFSVRSEASCIRWAKPVWIGWMNGWLACVLGILFHDADGWMERMQGAVYCFRSIISIESNLRVFVRFVSFCLFLISAPKLASYIAGGKDTDADSHSWLVSVRADVYCAFRLWYFYFYRKRDGKQINYE